ncbi:YnhF family membrane protein [Aeromonas bivalvium]|uniref:YnhF family membrane protein n=1 Tax=Aeromonas bivalvium TaxID=440079 RepID=A0ABW9GWN0_9GAMM|nr:YnhF family membrane protein [Aeromonas bivalvium]
MSAEMKWAMAAATGALALVLIISTVSVLFA